MQTQKQIIDRYNAKKAIFDAMMNGRRITMFDSQEFAVSQMHTMICFIRKDIERKKLPWVMKDEWVDFACTTKKCKRYWLEPKMK